MGPVERERNNAFVWSIALTMGGFRSRKVSSPLQCLVKDNCQKKLYWMLQVAESCQNTEDRTHGIQI